MSIRKVIEQIPARPASDGDGVKLLRVFGGHQPERFDPFLLMDEFGSESADDYIGGFPPHPHRGFSTITYMLQGKMEHRDHMGNVGLLNDGDVQWMTAGRGVIHSEMPKQTQGKMRGFQLWLNLPADKKMQSANYEDVPHDKIPLYEFDGFSIRAIAGSSHVEEKTVKGYFDVEETHALYFDLELEGNSEVTIPLTDDNTALVYVYDDSVALGDANTPSPAQTISRLSNEGSVKIKNPGEHISRVLVLSGKPLREPIAQYGPFVMNTQEQINEAIQDYRSGKLVGNQDAQSKLGAA